MGPLAHKTISLIYDQKQNQPGHDDEMTHSESDNARLVETDVCAKPKIESGTNPNQSATANSAFILIRSPSGEIFLDAKEAKPFELV